MPRALLVVAVLLLLVPAAAGAASKPNPKLGRTAWVHRVSGKVLVRGTVLRGARTVPLGSTVDASRGHVRVTTARNRAGALQSGVFNGGMFTIHQGRRSALTELRLAGPSGCSASAAGGGVHAARRSRRSLFGHAHGHFRTRGRQSSATIRGTVWATEDLCNGATLTRAFAGGHVEAKTKTSQQDLKPGQSSEDYCSDNGFPGVSDLYCMSLFSDPANDVFGFALVTYDPGSLGQNPPAPGPRNVDVCIRNPEGVDEPCRDYPLESIGGGAWMQSDGCSPRSGTGTYSVQWRLGGQLLPVPLTYSSTHRGAGIGCVGRPPGEPGPKPVAAR